MMDKGRIQQIWGQQVIPVILRRTGKGQALRVRLPWSVENRTWLRNGRRSVPAWHGDRRYWELPRAWFNDLVERALERFGQVYVIQPYREQEKCSPACQNARGHECQCSCMGEHHGQGEDGSWFVVSETFATRWGELELACRLMTRRP